MQPDPPAPRRRYGVIAALAAGAVAVTAGVVTLAPDPSPEPSRTPTPGPAAPAWSSTENIVAFADERNGWALTPRCASPTSCAPAFWRTLDGGATWDEVPVPADHLGRDSDVQLIAAGPRTITVESGRRRWLSVDGGREWRRGLATGTVRAPASPPGGAGVRLRTTVGSVRNSASPSPSFRPFPDRVLAWYAPDTGQPTEFPAQPGWQPISVSGGRDGSVWASGGNTQLALWTDGRWHALRPSAPPPPRTFVQVAAVDRTTAYLLFFGIDGESLLRPSAVSLTTDGGSTWTLRSLRGSSLRGSRDAATVGTRLVIVDSTGGARIVAPARTLAEPHPIDETPTLWSLDSSGGRLVGSTQDGRYYTTTDGETWTELPLPR